MTNLKDITDAATLILLRDTPDGRPEVLMVQRGKQLAFAGGNMVFPGGRIDEDDRTVAGRADLIVAGPSLDAEDVALRVTAIRETWEEVGLAPAVEGLQSIEQIELVREELAAGKAFSLILSEQGLRIDPYQLTMFSRWIPELEIARRFDTRFFVAAAPNIGEARVDGSESSRHRWATVAEHLETGNVIYPTRRNLERLDLAESLAGALELCARYPIAPITPWVEERDGVEQLCIRDDLGYPVTAEPTASVWRGTRPAMTRAPG